MSFVRQLPAFAAAFGLLASPAVAQKQAGVGELQETIHDLREQNKALQRALAESNKGEKQASEQLSQVRERLEALGKNLLDGGNDRLVQAAADQWRQALVDPGLQPGDAGARGFGSVRHGGPSIA